MVLVPRVVVLKVLMGEVLVELPVVLLGPVELLVLLLVPVPIGPYVNPEKYTNATEETRTMATTDMARTEL